MSVDTAAKRFSMLNFSQPDALWFAPDATIAQSDRQEMLGLYSGIAVSDQSATPGSGGPAVGGVRLHPAARMRVVAR